MAKALMEYRGDRDQSGKVGFPESVAVPKFKGSSTNVGGLKDEILDALLIIIKLTNCKKSI